MSLYAISLQPLITPLNSSSLTKQCWYADDAAGAGPLRELRKWWDVLNEMGPSLGYYPNAKKCWLLTKQGKEDAAREVFRDTAINMEEYVNGKVEGWVDHVVKLAEFAATYPQASHAAFTFGLKHRWTYYLRTLPDIEVLLEPLERALEVMLALPVRMGGLGITNPCHIAASEYEASTAITGPLVEQIVAQTHELPDDHAIRTLQLCNRRDKDARLREDLEEVKNAFPEQTKRASDLAAEKGASSWLTVIPVKDVDFTLNKREFKDAIHLRYDWQISDTPSTCACGDVFYVDHVMICRRGGFIIQRHNELLDLEAEC